MRLYNERLSNIIEYIIKKALQKGILLNSEEFKENLNKSLKNTDLTKPLFKKKDTKYGYTLDDYNTSKEDLNQDFNIFFNTIIELYKQLQENIDKYTSLKINKEKIIKEMEKELEEVIFQFAPNEYLNQFKEEFLNNNYIENTNNILINLINHEVLLNRSIIVKHPILASNISYDIDEPSYTCSKFEDGKPIKIVINKEKQYTTYCKIIIDLKESVYISSIDLSFSFIKPCSIEIETDNYLVFEEDIVKNKTIEINGFCRTITINFEKKEADKVILDSNSKILYQYIFCIDKIDIYKNRYVSKGTLETSLISLPENTESFKFDAEDYIPNNTKIEYFYRTNKDNNWTPLKKDIIYDISAFNKNNIYKTNNCISNEYEEEIKRNNLYIIKDFKNQISNNRTIYKGNNTWKQEIYKITQEEFNENTFLQDIALYSPWQTSYQDATERFGQLLSNSNIWINDNQSLDNYYYTQKILDMFYLEHQYIDDSPSNLVVKWSINVYLEESISDTYDIIKNNIKNAYVYINGVLSNTKYIFNKGWNKIEIYVYYEPALKNTKEEITKEDISEDNIQTKTLIIPFPQSVYKYILMDNKPLKEVDYQYLRFSKDIDKENEYAVLNKTIDNNNYQYILTANNDKNMDYLIEYKTIITNEQTIQLKAVLSSIDQLYTPKLYSYQLIYK